MSNPSDLSRQAWLLMLRVGGWWTQKELANQLGILKGSEQRTKLYYQIRALVASKVLAERTNEATKKRQYAVLPSCHMPRGMTVGEVQL